MGNNLDLCYLLGVPETILCPKCGRQVSSDFDDYDIECGDPNPDPGKWSLHCFCPVCEHGWQYRFQVTPQTQETALLRLAALDEARASAMEEAVHIARAQCDCCGTTDVPEYENPYCAAHFETEPNVTIGPSERLRRRAQEYRNTAAAYRKPGPGQ